MSEEQEREEILVDYHNGKFTINEEYIGGRSLLVAHEGLAIYQKLIPKYAKVLLLDLGCGTVPYYKIYKEQVDKIICIDWDNSLHENIHLDHIADFKSFLGYRLNYYQRYMKYQLIESCENNSLNKLSIQKAGAPLTVISDIIAKNLSIYLAFKIFQK